jgi:hypothetical protein
VAAGEKPAAEEADPPGSEEADLADKDSLRKSQVRPAELLELELGEVFGRDGEGDLIVDDSVESRDGRAEQARREYRRQIAEGDAGDQIFEHVAFNAQSSRRQTCFRVYTARG